MTDEKKRLGNTVSEGFKEILPYWDTEKNLKLGFTPYNVTASGRVTVHLKCPNCGREYERKLNNAYSVQKKMGAFDGYCAACRPRKNVEIKHSADSKPKDYELLGFYPELLKYFDEEANSYARMPKDKRFIVVHLDKEYSWKYRGKNICLTLESMIKKIHGA